MSDSGKSSECLTNKGSSSHYCTTSLIIPNDTTNHNSSFLPVISAYFYLWLYIVMFSNKKKLLIHDSLFTKLTSLVFTDLQKILLSHWVVTKPVTWATGYEIGMFFGQVVYDQLCTLDTNVVRATVWGSHRLRPPSINPHTGWSNRKWTAQSK